MTDDNKMAHDDDFDGIQEENNPLPRWWLFTFYAAIIFTPIYLYIWHGGDGRSTVKIYEADKAELDKLIAKKGSDFDPAIIDQIMTDTARVTNGKTVYATYCQACHAEQGKGLIGPNLTDKFWKNGKGSSEDIFKIVSTGVTDKGMPAWGQMLKKDEVIDVSAFIRTLANTEVPGGKAPEGEKVE